MPLINNYIPNYPVRRNNLDFERFFGNLGTHAARSTHHYHCRYTAGIGIELGVEIITIAVGSDSNQDLLRAISEGSGVLPINSSDKMDHDSLMKSLFGK